MKTITTMVENLKERQSSSVCLTLLRVELLNIAVLTWKPDRDDLPLTGHIDVTSNPPEASM